MTQVRQTLQMSVILAKSPSIDRIKYYILEQSKDSINAHIHQKVHTCGIKLLIKETLKQNTLPIMAYLITKTKIEHHSH